MKTQRIPIIQAVPGMISAEDVYNFSNQLVISSNTVLTAKIITRLKFFSISDINISLEEPTDHVLIPKKKKASNSELVKESVEFKKFKGAFVDSLQDFKGELGTIITSDSPIDTAALLEHTSKILEQSRNGIHVFDMLHCMREYDDITYVHSLSVSLICNVFGHWLKLSPADIEILTLSGLLHDVGKMALPTELMNKTEPLTDEEYAIIKTHTVKGYQILKNQDIDSRIKYATLMHHERCDGTGYPNSFHGPNINPFAKIVAIVDVYDAMTSARVYRAARSPFEAIHLFEAEGLQKYDPHYIMTFLEGIVQSYVGNRVRLSNHLEGEIRMINKHSLSKPIIQIGESFLDLSKEDNLVIQSVL